MTVAEQGRLFECLDAAQVSTEPAVTADDTPLPLPRSLLTTAYMTIDEWELYLDDKDTWSYNIFSKWGCNHHHQRKGNWYWNKNSLHSIFSIPNESWQRSSPVVFITVLPHMFQSAFTVLYWTLRPEWWWHNSRQWPQRHVYSVCYVNVSPWHSWAHGT